MDFFHIEKFKIDLIWLIDTSAILNDFKIEEYVGYAKDEKVPDTQKLIILVPAVLGEIDRVKTRNSHTSARENAVAFSSSLRIKCKGRKLSDGIELENSTKDILLFLPQDLKRIHDNRLSWLDEDGADKDLISIAIELKENHHKDVVVFTADNIMEFTCLEYDIKYTYVGADTSQVSNAQGKESAEAAAKSIYPNLDAIETISELDPYSVIGLSGRKKIVCPKCKTIKFKNIYMTPHD